jgi:hypothetical protein
MEEAVVFRAIPEIATQLKEAIAGARADVALSFCSVGGCGEVSAGAGIPHMLVYLSR